MAESVVEADPKAAALSAFIERLLAAPLRVKTDSHVAEELRVDVTNAAMASAIGAVVGRKWVRRARNDELGYYDGLPISFTLTQHGRNCLALLPVTSG